MRNYCFNRETCLQCAIKIRLDDIESSISSVSPALNQLMIVTDYKDIDVYTLEGITRGMKVW